MSSKLTFHVTVLDNKTLDLLEQMQPSLIKIFNLACDANIDEIQLRCPKSLLVYRQYTALSYMDPADAFVAELKGALGKLGGRGIVWEGINEPIVQSADDAHTLNNWYERFADLMHAKNEKVAAFSFSTGNLNLDWVSSLASSAAKCDYIALHEYYNPLTGSSGLTRYRQFRARLPIASQKPILITECGVDDGNNSGWLKYLSADTYLNLLINYDQEICKDGYVYGATIFQYGSTASSQKFDVTTLSRHLTDYVKSRSGDGIPDPAPMAGARVADIGIRMERDRLYPRPDNDTLHKFANVKNLGVPLTDPFEFGFNDAEYIGQEYELGIAFAKKGDESHTQWTKKPTEKNMKVDWCPFANKRPVVKNNFAVGRCGQTVQAVVLHIAAGPLSAVFPTFNNPTRQASAHFCVGKDGTIEQYVAVNDTAYGNGLAWINNHWQNARGKIVQPAWQGINAQTNPNLYTISIEHEGQPTDLWTDAMYEANKCLLVWLAGKFHLVYQPHRTLIGHCDIDPVDKANCPGPNVDYVKMSLETTAIQAWQQLAGGLTGNCQ